MYRVKVLIILKFLLNTQMIWTIFIEICNPNMKHEILIIFDDMIADMLNDKKLNPVVTELFIRGTKINISLVFYVILFCCSKKY